MSVDPRWWKLYRQERAKLLPGKKGWSTVATPQQITHAAREATRRFNEPDDQPPATEAAPKRPTPKGPNSDAYAYVCSGFDSRTGTRAVLRPPTPEGGERAGE